MDAKNEKALHRKCLALIAQNDYTAAEIEMKKLEELAHADQSGSIYAALKKLRQKMKPTDSETTFAKNLFGNDSLYPDKPVARTKEEREAEEQKIKEEEEKMTEEERR